MVYFIADTTNNVVKIGFSKSPKKRLQQLQTSNSNVLVLLGFIDGMETEESYCHQLFEKDKKIGEWFNLSDQIVDYINLNNLIYCSVERIDGKVYRLNKMKM